MWEAPPYSGVTYRQKWAGSGIVLAAIGLWYDDYKAGDPNPVTQDLIDVLTFTTGVEANDVAFKSSFPYQASPASGFALKGGIGSGNMIASTETMDMQALSTTSDMNLAAPQSMMVNYPNPAVDKTTFKYRVGQDSNVTLRIYDQNGNLVATPILNEFKKAGTYELDVNVTRFKKGTYYVNLDNNSKTIQSLKLLVN